VIGIIRNVQIAMIDLNICIFYVPPKLYCLSGILFK
jgi:hypothetical protein